MPSVGRSVASSQLQQMAIGITCERERDREIRQFEIERLAVDDRTRRDRTREQFRHIVSVEEDIPDATGRVLFSGASIDDFDSRTCEPPAGEPTRISLTSAVSILANTPSPGPSVQNRSDLSSSATQSATFPIRVPTPRS